MTKPTLQLSLQNDAADMSRRKYEVSVEVECVENLPAPAGTEVCFVVKRPGKVFASPAAEVWDQPTGCAYWDEKCTQVCTLTKQSDSDIWTSNQCIIDIQSVVKDSPKAEGDSFSLGDVLASAQLDIVQFCDTTATTVVAPQGDDEQPKTPKQIVLHLEPQGTLIVHISTNFLGNVDVQEDDENCSDVVCAEEEEEALDSQHTASTTAVPPPSLAPIQLPDDQQERQYLDLQEVVASCRPDGTSNDARQINFDTACAGNDGEGSAAAAVGVANINLEDTATKFDNCESDSEFLCPPPPPPTCEKATKPNNSTTKLAEPAAFCTPGSVSLSTSTTSSSLQRSLSMGTDGIPNTASALQKACRRLAKQRDEARAESFAQASVAVQRGIEIENLKRAKDMLLQRLETTERQLMGLARLDTDSSFEHSLPGSSGSPGEDHSKCSTADGLETQPRTNSEPDALLTALVEAKVRLAEQEFEVMELQGQLRAREAHIEALTAHLDAIHASTEAERRKDTWGCNSPRPSTFSPVPVVGSTAKPVAQQPKRVLAVAAESHVISTGTVSSTDMVSPQPKLQFGKVLTPTSSNVVHLHVTAGAVA